MERWLDFYIKTFAQGKGNRMRFFHFSPVFMIGFR